VTPCSSRRSSKALPRSDGPQRGRGPAAAAVVPEPELELEPAARSQATAITPTASAARVVNVLSLIKLFPVSLSCNPEPPPRTGVDGGASAARAARPRHPSRPRRPATTPAPHLTPPQPRRGRAGPRSLDVGRGSSLDCLGPESRACRRERDERDCGDAHALGDLGRPTDHLDGCCASSVGDVESCSGDVETVPNESCPPPNAARRRRRKKPTARGPPMAPAAKRRRRQRSSPRQQAPAPPSREADRPLDLCSGPEPSEDGRGAR